MIENEYGTMKIQEYLKGVLYTFHNFCVENDINYSVWDGTMLGAVRHKGFIPWDDDTDIILDRKNYEKLLSCYDNKTTAFNINDRLWIKRVELDDNPWSGCDGGVIDIFVFDNIPDSSIEYKNKVLLLKILQGMMKDLKQIHINNYKLLYRLPVLLTAVMGMPLKDKTKFQIYERISKWGNKKATKEKGVFNEPYEYIGRIHYRNDEDAYLIVPFEDIEVMILADYDDYLTRTYGDYMTLPPVEDRKAQHFDLLDNGEH